MVVAGVRHYREGTSSQNLECNELARCNHESSWLLTVLYESAVG